MTTTGPILSIDPGTRCGWCVMKPDGEIVECGTWALKLKDDERYGLRFLRLRYKIEEAVGRHGVKAVYYEDVRHHVAVQAAHVYGGLQAEIEAFCAAWDLPCTGVNVTTIKRCATGKSVAEKAEMVAATARKWPLVPITDDNMPDALWIAEAARTGFRVSTAKKKRKGRAAA